MMWQSDEYETCYLCGSHGPFTFDEEMCDDCYEDENGVTDEEKGAPADGDE